MDIDGWLRGIGLEQYTQTFRDNAIDADVLCDLTDEHLRELGLPLGARLKLLRAVAALSTGQTPISPEITTPRSTHRRRAPSGHGDVFGLGRFDGTLRSHGPGRPARSDFGLPEMRCRDRATLRRLRREVHGRRCSHLLRLSPSPRGRGRASRARRAGVGRCGGWPEDTRRPGDTGWHCDGTGGRRRSSRLRCFSGAGNRRRDPEPCRPLAGRCTAERCRDCRKYPQARGQPIRA